MPEPPSAAARQAEPSIWDAILGDPTLALDHDTRQLVIVDQQRWSRTWLYPLARIVSRLAVTLIVLLKRLVPLRLSAHGTMDRLCVWFLRRFVSPEAGTLLIRHFIIESNLLNFIARNAGLPGVRRADLLPTTLRGLGNRAVIEHDLNVYRLITDLGRATGAAPLRRRPQAELDLSMLTVPPIDPEPETRRFLRLDIQTALCLMNIPFALCLTADEYRRAVHSMRLDETLLAAMTAITGDPTFLAWRPAGFLIRVDTQVDVPLAVYEHAVICEYAHAHLLALGAAIETPTPAAEPPTRHRPPGVARPADLVHLDARNPRMPSDQRG
jgi:hypothetical protein